jgi:hypothetical protein
MFLRRAAYIHTTNTFIVSMICLEELERLVEGIPFEVLNQLGDSVRIGPCLATVVAGSESVGVVGLINKGALGLDEFLYRRPETAGKGGKDGFVDDPFLGRVIGIIVDCDQVIEGFDQFGFRLGGVEVGRRRRRRLRLLLPDFLLLFSGVGRSLFRSRLCDNDRSNGRIDRLCWNDWRVCLRRLCGCRRRSQRMSFC